MNKEASLIDASFIPHPSPSSLILMGTISQANFTV
jgi:hypothetical protein